MDAAKKTELEKRIVIGLGAVFVVTFLMGPLRSLSLFRGSSSGAGAAGDAEQIDVSKPLTAMLQQEDWKRQEPAPEPASPQTPPSPPAYTAHTLRDPFRNPLDLTSSAQAGAPGASVTSPGTSPAAPTPAGPPPALRVQGILWGGTEPKAIINNQVYGVRDVVAGAQILRIDRDGVLIDHYGTPHQYAPSVPTPKGVAGAVSGQTHQGR